MDNSIWGHTVYPEVTCGECPLSATHLGEDALTDSGHVDDYWIDYGNAGPDPYIVGPWGQHASADCTGDFMKTNQSARWIVKARGIVICWALLGMLGIALWSGESLASRFGQITPSQTLIPPVPSVGIGDLFAAAR